MLLSFFDKILTHTTYNCYPGRAHCDLLINNICEVFNRQLLEARDSPIISALEYVRAYLMKRIVIVQKIIAKSQGPLTPAVTKRFKFTKDASVNYKVDWNGLDLYEVRGPKGDQCVVNLTNRTCSCRKWEVSGIPCRHAVACIYDMADHGMDVGLPEDWVHSSYRLETWEKQYSFKINPVVGRHLWVKNDWPTRLLPPKVHVQIGRPPKKRKKSVGEVESMVQSGKMSRVGKQVTCKNCNGKGHNKRGCKQPQASTSHGQESQPSASQPQHSASQSQATQSQPSASHGQATQTQPTSTPQAASQLQSTPQAASQEASRKRMTKRTSNKVLSPTKKA